MNENGMTAIPQYKVEGYLSGFVICHHPPQEDPEDTTVAVLGSLGMMLEEAAIEMGFPSSVEHRGLRAAFLHLSQVGCIS